MESVTPPPAVAPFDLGAWVGKSQAFDSVADQCQAARAECLRQMRDSRCHEALGLTWEEFCRERLGIARSYADKLIHRLEEFGKPYFDLIGIAPISAEKYRALAPSVSGQGIEIDGEIVPITPENAPRIRQAVASVRAELRRASGFRANPAVSEFAARFNAWLFDLAQVYRIQPVYRPELKGLARYATDRLEEFRQKCEDGSFEREPIPASFAAPELDSPRN
jgi:hypothetical protein